MTALKKPYFVTVGDYLAGEELGDVKHEYIGGTVHAMAEAINRHNIIAGNCFGALFGKLRGKFCQPYNSDVKVRIEFPDHIRFYYPDATVVCVPNPDNEHFQDRPVVIVEVLSESTRRQDLSEKRDAYLTISTLKVLIFTEQEFPSALVYRRKSGGGFAVEEHDNLESIIPLPEIDAELPVADLYERVRFID